LNEFQYVFWQYFTDCCSLIETYRAPYMHPLGVAIRHNGRLTTQKTQLTVTIYSLSSLTTQKMKPRPIILSLLKTIMLSKTKQTVIAPSLRLLDWTLKPLGSNKKLKTDHTCCQTVKGVDWEKRYVQSSTANSTTFYSSSSLSRSSPPYLSVSLPSSS